MTKWKPIPAADVPPNVRDALARGIPYTHHGHRFCEALNPPSETLYRLNLATGKYSRTVAHRAQRAISPPPPFSAPP